MPQRPACPSVCRAHGQAAPKQRARDPRKGCLFSPRVRGCRLGISREGWQECQVQPQKATAPQEPSPSAAQGVGAGPDSYRAAVTSPLTGRSRQPPDRPPPLACHTPGRSRQSSSRKPPTAPPLRTSALQPPAPPAPEPRDARGLPAKAPALLTTTAFARAAPAWTPSASHSGGLSPQLPQILLKCLLLCEGSVTTF